MMFYRVFSKIYPANHIFLQHFSLLIVIIRWNGRVFDEPDDIHVFTINNFMRHIFALLITFVFSYTLFGSPESDPNVKRYTISGHVKDDMTGEDLFGAAILVVELNTGTVSNEYGFYSISLPKGQYTLRYTYLGYEPHTRKLNLEKDEVLDIRLMPSLENLNEVEIKAEKADAANIRTPADERGQDGCKDHQPDPCPDG